MKNPEGDKSVRFPLHKVERDVPRLAGGQGEVTPMVAQYREIKARHQDAILFYRLGDFYEMFNEDAELASRELDLTLTGRGKDENRMPMCGIPYHAAQGYIARLIEKGYKVAICEQTEDPNLAKGLVKREVVRIVTPGTVLESDLLSEKSSNYLAAISLEKGKYGLAYVEASTGEFKTTDFTDETQLKAEIDRIAPAETIAAKNGSAVDAILEYLKQNRKTRLGHIGEAVRYSVGEFMLIDPQTRRNLELIQTIRDRAFKGSLLWVLDQCRTSMGSRLLKNWLLAPLLNREEIERRLEAVAELHGNAILRAELSRELDQVFDIERLTGRAASGAANARDLISLAESLTHLPRIADILKNSKTLKVPNPLPEVTDLIHRAIVNDPPFVLTAGGIIKDGYNAELDELKQAARGGKSWITELENKERLRTGIKSLKVGFTKVFGYYIEVSNANQSAVPADYIRKQTLVNCERFITPELKDKESFILNAEERLKDMEYKIFCEVREQVAEHTKELQSIARQLARIDVLLSLAEVAVANNFCRPRITGSADIRITESRHPVVEKTLGEQKFTPNNIVMDAESRFLMITGPNMAGKSTYMRQVALICLMAQIGSFVPAASAELAIIDRIFTRIGAMDDIFSGQSTFMLEMTETANILKNATENSLIILDEIGRGTATFDGMSIAAAVAEYIHEKIKAKTLFATHYHEITQLAEKHPGMKNFNVLVKEVGEEITFLHKIAEGPADKSYGIAVAKLAGLPAEVVKRAREVYNTLEMAETDLLG
ncbi:DNA mismatch repair protein MutS [Candidatus Saganbacteria bacterium]|nr:DNA mismatch repair protein MutS [Candidatus Saganbacteria bacterium]